MSKVVFVGNVPYNMGEEQLIDVFKSVGQVVGFRLVFDRDTGKPKGYGFCEFADHETAVSAVRNLNNTDVGGRPLRIDLADSDPFLEGKTTVRGELLDDGNGERPQWRHHEDRGRGDDRGGRRDRDGPSSILAGLPAGIPVPPGSSSLDLISQTLATMPQTQLLEVLAQMKAFIITHPEQARTLLIAHPQLAYSLFQALLLNNIVDQAILDRMLQAGSRPSVPSAPPAAPAVPPQHPLMPPPSMPHFPPQHQPFPPTAPSPVPGFPPASVPPASAMFPHAQPPHQPPPPAFFRPPPAAPAPASVPAPAPVPQAPAIPDIDPAQRAILMQVLSMSQDQINALPPTERDAIQQLRSQLGGSVRV
ncbi:hypothetical protein HGRIS_012421 [Hohenbuehelia grisea]|uniref:RRM domain-containing protein n=1 Tax=Hohenbuehelia grisea TaxID=104357 RepID=A0ABR3IS91_9AGAR